MIERQKGLWVVSVGLLVASALAGCVGGDAETVPVMVLPAGSSEKGEPSFTFTLIGASRVQERDREVTIKIYDETGVRDFATYTARPGEAETPIKVYRLFGGTVHFDIIAEEQRVASGYLHVEECPGPDSDAIIRVHDTRVRHGDGNIEVSYGCR